MEILNNYIHTTTPSVSKLNEPYMKPIYDHSKTCLISLIHSLSSSSFGRNTVEKGVEEIQKYKETYLQGSFPFILDSGGYSIIAGDVSVIDIIKFIECYTYALELLRDDYDYVFSLDIPVFLNAKDQLYLPNGSKIDPNSSNAIEYLNHKSLTESLNIIEKFPIIKEKFNMVLQWKMPKQYIIWDKLYDQLNLKEYINSYAIGGLVGLLGICPHINFAPFIGAAYYWLYRYIERGNFSKPLFIHILGQYHKSARFMIFFLELLFTDYLKIVNQKCIITYDTINYSLSSMYKTRVGVDVYYFNNGEFNTVHSYDLNDEILKRIYTTDDSLIKFHENWDNIKNDSPLNDTSFLIPTYIYSQLQLDNFFKYFINQYNIVDIFRSKDIVNDSIQLKWKSLDSKFKSEFCRFNKYSSTLKSNFNKTILNSLKETYNFHTWFIYENLNKKELDKRIFNFINKVNFPFDLT